MSVKEYKKERPRLPATSEQGEGSLLLEYCSLSADEPINCVEEFHLLAFRWVSVIILLSSLAGCWLGAANPPYARGMRPPAPAIGEVLRTRRQLLAEWANCEGSFK